MMIYLNASFIALDSIHLSLSSSFNKFMLVYISKSVKFVININIICIFTKQTSLNNITDIFFLLPVLYRE